jgi:hypothetical protein
MSENIKSIMYRVIKGKNLDGKSETFIFDLAIALQADGYVDFTKINREFTEFETHIIHKCSTFIRNKFMFPMKEAIVLDINPLCRVNLTPELVNSILAKSAPCGYNERYNLISQYLLNVACTWIPGFKHR